MAVAPAGSRLGYVIPAASPSSLPPCATFSLPELGAGEREGSGGSGGGGGGGRGSGGGGGAPALPPFLALVVTPRDAAGGGDSPPIVAVAAVTPGGTLRVHPDVYAGALPVEVEVSAALVVSAGLPLPPPGTPTGAAGVVVGIAAVAGGLVVVGAPGGGGAAWVDAASWTVAPLPRGGRVGGRGGDGGSGVTAALGSLFRRALGSGVGSPGGEVAEGEGLPVAAGVARHGPGVLVGSAAGIVDYWVPPALGDVATTATGGLGYTTDVGALVAAAASVGGGGGVGGWELLGLVPPGEGDPAGGGCWRSSAPLVATLRGGQEGGRVVAPAPAAQSCGLPGCRRRSMRLGRVQAAAAVASPSPPPPHLWRRPRRLRLWPPAARRLPRLGVLPMPRLLGRGFSSTSA